MLTNAVGDELEGIRHEWCSFIWVGYEEAEEGKTGTKARVGETGRLKQTVVIKGKWLKHIHVCRHLWPLS